MAHIKYAVGILVLLCISAVYVFTVQADVALFHSDTYVEEGTELFDENGVVNRIQYEHTWTDFKGVVPVDVEVNSIILHLTWSKVARTEELFGTSTEVMTVTESPAPILEKEEHNDNSSHTGTDSVSPTNEITEPEPVVRESVEDADIESIVPVDDVTPPVVPIPTPETNAIESVSQSEPVLDAEVPSLTPVLEESPTDTTGFEEVSAEKLFTFAVAEFEESTPPDVVVSLSPQETESESVLTTESATSSINEGSTYTATHTTDTPFFEIFYSVDGIDWQLLKHVGFDEEQDLYADLTGIGYEALSRLRILIQYTISEDELEKIAIDSLRLEVGYTERLIEVIPTSINYDERMPNFETSAIIHDVYSENIRATVLSRGGVFEFWYSVTDGSSGEIVWNKILGGGPIDPTAPIAITERTIFWLDQNQQTLYGYGVDENSIFGIPFQDPEHKVFILPFEDEDGKKWEAMFNAETNKLEFQKIKTRTR